MPKRRVKRKPAKGHPSKGSVMKRSRMAETAEAKDELEELEICGRQLADTEALADDELPLAVGGVEVDAISADEACGCDVEFDDYDATPDDELPEAKGGVA